MENFNQEKITAKNLGEIKLENIKMFSFACAGAMGEEGEIIFAHFDKELKFYSINWCYDSFMEEVNNAFFKPFATLFNQNDCVVLPTIEGWQRLKLGMGNFLFIREESINQFEKIVNEYKQENINEKFLLYNTWQSIAKKCYEREKKC